MLEASLLTVLIPGPPRGSNYARSRFFNIQYNPVKITLFWRIGSGKRPLLRAPAVSSLEHPPERACLMANISGAPTSEIVIFPRALTCFPWLNVKNKWWVLLALLPWSDPGKSASSLQAIIETVGLTDAVSRYPPSIVRGGMPQRGGHCKGRW